MTYIQGIGLINTQKSIQSLANQGRGKAGHARRKVFISYHRSDEEQVRKFVESFRDYYQFKCVGISDDHQFVDSNNDEYIKRRIREDYLADTTVTILMVGKCTWSRSFVDWEISATLRNDEMNKRSGLVGIALPELNGQWILPPRAKDNWNRDQPNESYLIGINYPRSVSALVDAVDKAISKRDNRADLVDNRRPLQRINQICKS